jgi:predicted DsbA family dithiol-disulfide isomerase
MKPVIRIDVISDVVCPWCYIGKRRLEKAIEEQSGKFEFQLHYHPFELNPDLSENGVDQKEHLAKKFGGEIRYQEITSHTTQVAADEGLQFDFNKQKILPNTRVIHAIIAAAAEYGKQPPVAEAFFRSYFSEGIDLTKKENLLSVAKGAGLENEVVERILKDDSYLLKVEIAENEFKKLGVNAVPFYIINNRYGISGAQATETFAKAFEEITTTEALDESA